jgi:hypothetical protein
MLVTPVLVPAKWPLPVPPAVADAAGAFVPDRLLLFVPARLLVAVVLGICRPWVVDAGDVPAPSLPVPLKGREVLVSTPWASEMPLTLSSSCVCVCVCVRLHVSTVEDNEAAAICAGSPVKAACASLMQSAKNCKQGALQASCSWCSFSVSSTQHAAVPAVQK